MDKCVQKSVLTSNLLFAFFELTSWSASPLNTHGVPNESKKKELKLKAVAVATVVGVVVKLLTLLLLQISEIQLINQYVSQFVNESVGDLVSLSC